MSKEDILSKENEEIVSDALIKNVYEGSIRVGEKEINRLSSQITFKDQSEHTKVRLGIGRYSYKVPPGVYAIGTPEKGSAMFVTCNYKLTVDIVREALEGYDCFLLVLDTKGINVWCAAGKGTFSSRELIYQLHKHQVKKELGVRKVYLPQLGASTMEPHLVRKYTGISVIYGPVSASDLPKFIDKGFECTKEMRLVSFSLKDRMLLAPLEMLLYFKFVLFTILIAAMLEGVGVLQGASFDWGAVVNGTLIGFIGLLVSTILFPMLLPYLPFRMFSYKGYLLGGLLLIEGLVRSLLSWGILNGVFVIWLLLMMGYITFSFTGSTTFTAQSGVEIEAVRFKRHAIVGLVISFLLLLVEVIA